MNETRPVSRRLLWVPLLALGAALCGVSAAPAYAQAASPKVLKKVPLDFPQRAVRAGVDRGVLKTRVTVDGSGSVTAVEVVETQPAKARMLAESAIACIMDWKFEGNGKNQSFDLQLVVSAD